MLRTGRRACRSTRCRSLRARPRGPLETVAPVVARVAAYPCDYPSRKDGVQKSMESISGRCRTPSNPARGTACLRVITSGFCAQIRGIPPRDCPAAAAPAPAPAPRSAARRRQRTFVDRFLPGKTPKTRDFTLAKPGIACRKSVQSSVHLAKIVKLSHAVELNGESTIRKCAVVPVRERIFSARNSCTARRGPRGSEGTSDFPAYAFSVTQSRAKPC